jgi:hypothetical protein
MATVHIVPIDDQVPHVGDASCVCGPTVAPVHDDGRVAGFTVTHHSLDGRELHEHEWRQRLTCWAYRLIHRRRPRWLLIPDDATESVR